MRQVVYHPQVPTEAREILSYYESINPRLGDRFWNELTSAIEHARKHPEHHHFDQLAIGLRRSNLKKFPVHFLFKVFPAFVRITTIRHDRRNPTYGIKRL